ncbi:hypothetical protein RFI_22206 [Reticulomyxa filosa]|uniref:Uncharacterized protein n=1 Tax=Reticulomyxa filosa TaxID=46433 RepID=X6MMR4_RETFI|nr:hypothetical protein RFI_22206 [Reticulomyxa filosa]|eukprot:ETO15159.1 hypothetical protein RFI_22206 [Reticulomyxa filosa]
MKKKSFVLVHFLVFLDGLCCEFNLFIRLFLLSIQVEEEHILEDIKKLIERINSAPENDMDNDVLTLLYKVSGNVKSIEKQMKEKEKEVEATKSDNNLTVTQQEDDLEQKLAVYRTSAMNGVIENMSEVFQDCKTIKTEIDKIWSLCLKNKTT